MKPFQLLDLPPELRNQIYTYAAKDTTLDFWLLSSKSGRSFSSAWRLPHVPLLWTNEQVRAEAAGLLWRHSNINFIIDHDEAQHISSFVSEMAGQACNLVRNPNVTVRTRFVRLPEALTVRHRRLFEGYYYRAFFGNLGYRSRQHDLKSMVTGVREQTSQRAVPKGKDVLGGLMHWRFVTLPAGARPGQVLPVVDDQLLYDEEGVEAMQTDCPDCRAKKAAAERLYEELETVARKVVSEVTCFAAFEDALAEGGGEARRHGSG